MWVLKTEGVRAAAVGMDALGLASLGDLAFIVLNETGTEVKRGEPLGTLEAAKMTGEIIAPVSGVVAARNGAALGDPSSVNQDPYRAGWLVTLTPTAWDAEAAQLVSGEAIPAWVAAEIERYREEGWIE